MHYLDGDLIKIGDVIFWNEGVCLGVVSGIFETSDELDGVSQSSPGVMLSFSISQMNPLPSGMFIELADFEDEGIKKCPHNILIKLTETHAKIGRVAQFARHISDSYGINRYFMPDYRARAWVFIYYENISDVRALLLVNEDMTKASIISDTQFIKFKEASSIIGLDLCWIELR